MTKCPNGYQDLHGVCKKDVEIEPQFDARDRVIRLDVNGKNLDLYISPTGKVMELKGEDIKAGSNKREYNRFMEDVKEFVGREYDARPNEVKIIKAEALPNNHPDKTFAEFTLDVEYDRKNGWRTLIGVDRDLEFTIFSD